MVVAKKGKPHRFKKGDKKPPASGRLPGTKNKVSIMLAEAIMMAPDRIGSDGKGKDGIDGWLEQQARRFPKQYLGLLARVLPHKIEGNINNNHVFGSREEIEMEMKRRGLPMPNFSLPAKIIEHASKPMVRVIEGKKKARSDED